MTRFAACLATFLIGLMLTLPGAAVAQAAPGTLADIRAELAALGAELGGLRQELAASGAAATATGGGSALERMDAVEAELQRLTARTEELENRINKVVADGTNRIGDLEFRVTELEGGDVSALPATPPLGGEDGAIVVPGDTDPDAGGAELALGEQADFDRAKAALDTGDFRGAADLFAAFTQSYTGGSLTAQAHFQRGEALAALGDTTGAAKAYLDSFSGAPSGPMASDALYKLGVSLSQLGQMQEACVTLGEVGLRFPGTEAAVSADRERIALQCL